jgi:hypothetical protein
MDYTRNSYHDEFIDFSPHFSSHASSHFFHGPNHCSYVLVHERIALCLDTLVTAHVLILVIVPHVGTIFLLEGLILTLIRVALMVHASPVMVHVPLAQMVRCKGL